MACRIARHRLQHERLTEQTLFNKPQPNPGASPCPNSSSIFASVLGEPENRITEDLSKNVTSVGQFAPCLSGNGTGRRIRNYVFEFRDHEPEFRRRDSADSREQGRRCHLAWIGGTDVVVSVPKIDAHFQTIQHVERNIMRPRVLISDELPHASVEVLEAAGCHVTYQPQLGKRDEAGSVIGACGPGRLR